MAFDWPKNPDGSNKKLGELTPDQQRQAWREAAAKVGAEMNDPNSAMRRGIAAVLGHGSIPKA